MRGLIAFLLLVLVALNLLNWAQIQQLKGQVAALQGRVQKSEQSDAALSAIMEQTGPVLAQAQEAIRKADYAKARELLQQATTRAKQMSHSVGDNAAPALAWLRAQAQTLEGQMKVTR